MTTVTISIPVLGKKIRLDEESALIFWEDGFPCTDIKPVQPESLFREEYAPEIEKALAIWRECRWEVVTVREMIPSADCSHYVESESEPFHKLVQGNPLPWMGHWMDEGSIRRHVITEMAKADGAFEVAVKAAAQDWLNKAITEGGVLVEDGLPPFFDPRPGIIQDLQDWGWDVPEGTLAGYNGDECVLCIPGKSPIYGDYTEELAEKLGIEL